MATKKEISTLIRYGKSPEVDAMRNAERMLVSMKERGVDLSTVQQQINTKAFDNRNIQEFVAQRINYVETGVESPYSMQRRASEAKGRRSRKPRKNSTRGTRRRRR